MVQKRDLGAGTVRFFFSSLAFPGKIAEIIDCEDARHTTARHAVRLERVEQQVVGRARNLTSSGTVVEESSCESELMVT